MPIGLEGMDRVSISKEQQLNVPVNWIQPGAKLNQSGVDFVSRELPELGGTCPGSQTGPSGVDTEKSWLLSTRRQQQPSRTMIGPSFLPRWMPMKTRNAPLPKNSVSKDSPLSSSSETRASLSVTTKEAEMKLELSTT
jgi:hypothetical protein